MIPAECRAHWSTPIAFLNGDNTPIVTAFRFGNGTGPATLDTGSNSAVNLSTGVNVGRYQLSLFVKNLLDNKTILQAPTVNSVTMGYTLRPLTVGLSLQAKF